MAERAALIEEVRQLRAAVHIYSGIAQRLRQQPDDSSPFPLQAA